MAQLSPGDRELLYALFWDRQSTRQVGQSLGVDHATVIRRCRRVLAKLRSELSDVA
jgi:DNA-directed RNA polymerase specialized sigma24 family protein